ncbi:MAG: response regulator [Mucilaginibacter sp.]|nr:response regulator [Mucilaginibacter sp.]
MQRILAVDDNEDILEIMQLILEDSGYEVATLTDGHFLFDKIKEYRPDLILLDIMLGNMDGRELCKDVKSKLETHNIPVILISASHNLSGLFKPSNAPNDFLAKPFNINDLLDKVHTQLSAA